MHIRTRTSERGSSTRHGEHSATVDPGTRGHSLLQPPLASTSLAAHHPPPRLFCRFPLDSLPSPRHSLVFVLRLRLPNRDLPLSQPPRDSISSYSSFSSSFMPCSSFTRRAAMYPPGGTTYVNSWYILLARIFPGLRSQGTKSGPRETGVVHPRRLLFIKFSPDIR